MSDEIDWKRVAALMARKVEKCCGCNWAANLTDDETAAVEATLKLSDQEVVS